MTVTDFDLWAGMDVEAPPEQNLFDPDRFPEEHAAHERSVEKQREEVRAAREQQRMHEEIQRQLFAMRARAEATRLYAAEQAEHTPVPGATSLTDLLGEPDEEAAWRFEGVWPRHGNIVLSAQYKAGKTTLVGNVLRSLVDGDRFLGIYPVDPVADGTIAVTDFEMPRNKIRDWLRDQGIVHTDRVQVWTMRGKTSAFDLTDETVRQVWIDRLRELSVRVWIVDCLGPILSALGYSENENKEVGRFLDALTATATAADVDEVLLVHHMGHGAERSRGASRLRDWPDAEWRLVRQKDDENPFGEPDPAAPRFFTAFGRDVDVREGQLVFDPETRRLVYAEGNRKQARATAALMFVLSFVRDRPSSSVRAIQDASATAEGITRDSVRDAVKHAIAEGFLTVADGPNRSNLHTLTSLGHITLGGNR